MNTMVMTTTTVTIRRSHDIRPLPAYDENHVLVPPPQYKLEVIGYCRIKKSKRDFFNAVLQECIVMSCHVIARNHAKQPLQTSPVNAGPSAERQNKGKVRSEVD
ncbi:hypothetical protein DFH29DRAFT_1064982 [Suillus ampliporus]|nr:hypothetical protein DFH29DRAFT_1064982 [Suillus ampliporus]